jgi:osmoprotectant transport system ATP-binding protein
MNDQLPDASVVIRFQDVKKSYGEKVAIEEINFEIRKGELVTIIGSSGCGKTTMLKLINGLLTPDCGTISVYGEDIRTVDQIKLRRKIGYVIQGVGLFPHLNVKKNILFIPGILKFNKNKSDRIAQDLIRMVGLEEDILYRYPSELSGGQQQRVGVARALAASPDILLMDEPFGAVDEMTRTMLQEELLKIHGELGITILLITHDLREAIKLGERLLVMDEGRIICDNSPKKIMNDRKLKALCGFNTIEIC